MVEDPVSVLERELVRAARRRAASAIAPQLSDSPLHGASPIVIGSFSERRQAQLLRQQRRVGSAEAAFLVALVVCVAAAVLVVLVH